MNFNHRRNFLKFGASAGLFSLLLPTVSKSGKSNLKTYQTQVWMPVPWTKYFASQS